jgi:uncharacterized protein
MRCDYCYMYTMADQSWRSRPRAMSRSVIDAVAFRIAEHAASHGIDDADIVLHGGEPLLAGPEIISYAVDSMRAALRSLNTVRISVQTNGLLLDQSYLERLADLDVKVGLSLDGNRAMHDRHRRMRNGAGSFDAAASAAARLAAYPGLFSGFLSVIDLRNDPVEAYESLIEFAPPTIDFLLPHGNWSAPPPGPPETGAAHPYGSWLSLVFDRWYRAPQQETNVRLFSEIMNLLLGGTSATEGIGTSPVAVVVIESDGDITRSDTVQAVHPLSAGTGKNVAAHSFDSIVLPTGAANGPGLLALASQCQACPVGLICGGGLYAHRYRAGDGFDNPSVYCSDLYYLIMHIRGRMVADLGRLSRVRP